MESIQLRPDRKRIGYGWPWTRTGWISQDKVVVARASDLALHDDMISVQVRFEGVFTLVTQLHRHRRHTGKRNSTSTTTHVVLILWTHQELKSNRSVVFVWGKNNREILLFVCFNEIFQALGTTGVDSFSAQPNNKCRQQSALTTYKQNNQFFSARQNKTSSPHFHNEYPSRWQKQSNGETRHTLTHPGGGTGPRIQGNTHITLHVRPTRGTKLEPTFQWPFGEQREGKVFMQKPTHFRFCRK